MKKWISNELSEFMFLHLNIRHYFTVSHPPKGENRTRKWQVPPALAGSLSESLKVFIFDLPESPDDILTSTVSDALLFKAIAKCGGEEIDLKVNFFPNFIQFSYF